MRARLVWAATTIATCVTLLTIAVEVHVFVALVCAVPVGYAYGVLAGALET